MVNEWLRIIQGAILPTNCVLCGDRGQPPLLDMCKPCVSDLLPNRSPCQRCAAPLPCLGLVNPLCADCIERGPSFDRAIAPFQYDYPLDHLIRAFKYHSSLTYGRVLGTLLARHLILREDPLPDLLLPVPLHPSRHRERGFNQAIELSRPLSHLLGIPMDEQLCRRTRATEDQTELSASQRRRNIQDAFSLTRTPHVGHVAIVDDVLTTGSTTQEMARVLKRSGVKQVEVWAVARAMHYGKM